MSNAIKSQGTVVQISNENADTTVYGSATFATVGECDDVGEFSGEASDIDVTSLQSPAKEYLIGLADFGTMQITGNFIPTDTGQIQCIASLDAQQNRWLKVIFSQGTVWYIKACCKKFTPGAKVDNKVPFTSTFRTSGARTII